MEEKQAHLPTKRDRFLDRYMSDSLEIHCTRIRLTQSSAQLPTIYEAPGTLRLGKSFGMDCELHVPQRGATFRDALALISSSKRPPAGQLLAPDQYYRLEAVDEDGAVWTHPALTLSIRVFPEAYAVRFGAEFVENVAQIEGEAYACRLTYVEDLNLPTNLYVDERRPDGSYFSGRHGSEGRLANLDLVYRLLYMKNGSHRGEIEVRAVDDRLPQHADIRLIETLQFCSAMSASPICIEVANGYRRSIRIEKHKPAHQGLVLPPLQGRSADKDFYRLATAFYEHACRTSDYEGLSPIFSKVRSIFELSDASVEPIALILCVAVEGLAQFGELRALTLASDEHREVVEGALFAVLEMPQFAALAQRFESAKTGADRRTLEERVRAVFSMLSQGGRTKDILRLLEAADAVTAEEIRAWDNLRHPSAHGSWEFLEEKFQVDLDKMYRILTLVYRMVFFHIGYQGQFANRSMFNWPSGSFDPKALVGDQE